MRFEVKALSGQQAGEGEVVGEFKMSVPLKSKRFKNDSNFHDFHPTVIN